MSKKNNIGFLASCPLLDDDGTIFGSLCLVNIDSREDLNENNLNLMILIYQL